MGKERIWKERPENSSSLSSSLHQTPTPSCHSYSACRRSHFVRSSRALLITCLFGSPSTAFLPFWPPACLPCADSLRCPTAVGFEFFFFLSLDIVLHLMLCCSLILLSQRSLRIELGLWTACPSQRRLFTVTAQRRGFRLSWAGA